jgi:large subunit ribosomal protein L29
MKKERMRELTKEELLQSKSEMEQEILNLRLQRASKELDNPLRLRVLRRDIAKINTMLREDELKIRPLAKTEEKVASSQEKQE